MKHLACLIWLACLVLWRTPPAGATVTQLPGLIREPATLHVTLPNGNTADLESLVTRPARPGRFPLVIINHGFPRDRYAVSRMTPEAYSGPAIVFAQHGYAVAVVNRRGFGWSSGLADVPASPCDGRHYEREGRASAVDIVAAVIALRREPWVDPDRIVLLGHSSGGLGVLAAAAGPLPGVVGILNFAGGRGSIRPDFVCNPDGLVRSMQDFGARTHLPSLWLYSVNDHFFGPAIARQMFDAYTGAGASAEFYRAPAFANDGHQLILATESRLWWPRVASFLEKLRLPTATAVASTPQPVVPDPPGLGAHGKADFGGYLSSRAYEKAFATDGRGHHSRAFGRRTQEAAASDAITHCRDQGWQCHVYAIGNTLSVTTGKE